MRGNKVVGQVTQHVSLTVNGRRRAAARLHHARRLLPGALDRDDRIAKCKRRSERAAAGVPREARRAMRLLHAGEDHGGGARGGGGAMSGTVAGHPAPLIDGIEKVTGRARYTADLGFSALWGEILRSPHAHAEIVRIDTSRARALPGVRAVLSGDDCDVPYGILPIAQNEFPLARGRVRYWGEPVAAVAADDEKTARAALDLLEV